MDFFSSQDDARRRTRRLIALFVLSVTTIVILMYGLTLFFTKSGTGIWDARVFGLSTAGTLGVILLGSGYKTLQLSAHGGEVARDLGGRPIDPDSTQPDERRLLNVVEEMALASGVPVPQVWVLDDEDGINAFASGHSPADAAIGVTRGCLRTLTRSELQGVIAHEFSHILNGDMRLNLRMIGLIHGILILAIAGRLILRSASRSRHSSRDNRSGAAILLAGLGLLAIGSLGVFFTKLIKSAISRQREFLADASAVQFTRHPESIGNALLKIGGSQYGSRLTTARAEEASHMMFGNALRGGRMKWFATHPPLETRIRAILPQWDGKWPEVALPGIASEAEAEPETDDRTPPSPFPFPFPSPSGSSDSPGAAAILGTILAGQVSGEHARTAIDRIGNVTDEELAAARELHAKIPEWLRSVLRDPGGAQATIFAVILFAESGVREGEVNVLTELVDASTRELTLRIAGHIADWHSCHLIALVDLAIPALRRLSPAEYARFSRIMTALIQSDRKVDLFEFMLQKIVRRHLDQYFHRSPPPRIRFPQWQQVEPDAAVLLSAMAAAGARDADARAAAFAAGRASLQSGDVDITTDAPLPDLAEIDAALDRFDAAAPPLKRLLLHACGTAAVHDGRLSSDEAELLRAMADTIGCPLPPFVRSATAAD